MGVQPETHIYIYILNKETWQLVSLIIGCNTAPRFVEKFAESSWTNLGECIVGAGEVSVWWPCHLLFRATSESCPQSKTQLEKSLCLEHVSQALSPLPGGAYYFAMAVATKPGNDGVCAPGAIAVAARANAMITGGAIGVSLFCCEAPETWSARDNNEIMYAQDLPRNEGKRGQTAACKVLADLT